MDLKGKSMIEFKKEGSVLKLYVEDREAGFAECVWAETSVEVRRVVVNDLMRGRGLASRIMEAVFSEAGERRVIPICSYAVWWMSEQEK